MNRAIYFIFTAIFILILTLVIYDINIFNEQLYLKLAENLPNGLTGFLLLFFSLVVLTSIGLPRQIAAFICGYSLGAIYGTIVATCAATLGCLVTLLVANRYGHHYISTKYPKKQQQIAQFFQDKLFYKAIVIRILPLGSNFITNIIAGVCQLNTQQYVLGSFVGFIPQMVIFSLAGAGIKLTQDIDIIITISLLIITFMLSFYLFRAARIKQIKN